MKLAVVLYYVSGELSIFKNRIYLCIINGVSLLSYIGGFFSFKTVR